MLRTVCAPAECVIVAFTSGMSITTSSFGPGSAPVLQLAGVFQSPPAGLVQLTAKSVRSSRCSSTGQRRSQGLSLRGPSERLFLAFFRIQGENGGVLMVGLLCPGRLLA